MAASPDHATAPTFDLQSHSLHSDGTLAPAEVVAAAARAGVVLLALTDHDSVDGVAEAQTAAAAYGVTLVSAAEISVLDASGSDLHLLGYRVDVSDPALTAALARSREAREQRAELIVGRLEELGWHVDRTFLAAHVDAGTTVGRPHLAEAVLRAPANAPRLAAEGLPDATAFLVAYLIEGRPAFLPREAPTVAEAIALIHGAGGLAVWAHPFWDLSADPDVCATLERFCAEGLDGVEAFYITHTAEQTALLVSQAAGLGLLTTGSADFHGPGHRLFHRFRAFSTHGLPVNLGPIAEPLS
ncbi:PHP domain-containing protein [Conexibacter sp. DBS9H8]|uniref:PHP domain-containing protein n=1 Tax=Conexibacter sp. DBS9H8 TaxID=2937801 RepID=UPI00200CCA4A|nr:PHP domain-containing protein [Conexibacter sp. DBS9H8]